jgi:glycosyltransferase involved in cell wall biosynthesis
MAHDSPVVQLASLDLFWIPEIAFALRGIAQCELLSTWAPQKPVHFGVPHRNAWALHCLLAAYKRFPQLRANNYSYLALCKAFDHWLATHLNPKSEVLYILSGVGKCSLRKARRAGAQVVVESGSTETEYQHRVVGEEYRRNGLRGSLFPTSYRRRVRSEIEEADFVQVPSEFVRRTYLESGVPASKLLLARYGADVARFAARTEGDRSEVFRVICPSGVNLRKGARLLVEAWHRLAWNPREAELHWVGWRSTPEARHLFVNEPQGIIWHRWMAQEMLSKLYRSGDVLVLPSFEEGFARVLVEGAASGLALIATPNTGVEDFFSPANPEGWLVPCNDVDALCDALRAARADRDATFQRGQQAAARARDGFSRESYAVQVQRNFKKILDRRSAC